MIGFNNSRMTHFKIACVGAHFGDSEFRGKPVLHRHLANADKAGEEIVKIGGAIIASILRNNKGQVWNIVRHAGKRRGVVRVIVPTLRNPLMYPSLQRGIGSSRHSRTGNDLEWGQEEERFGGESRSASFHVQDLTFCTHLCVSSSQKRRITGAPSVLRIRLALISIYITSSTWTHPFIDCRHQFRVGPQRLAPPVRPIP